MVRMEGANACEELSSVLSSHGANVVTTGLQKSSSPKFSVSGEL